MQGVITSLNVKSPLKNQICFSFQPLRRHLGAKPLLLNVMSQGFSKTCIKQVMVLIIEDDGRSGIASHKIQPRTLLGSSTAQHSIRADDHVKSRQATCFQLVPRPGSKLFRRGHCKIYCMQLRCWSYSTALLYKNPLGFIK